MEHSPLYEIIKNNGDASQHLYSGSPEKEYIIDLQRILFELGFGKELKFDRYQADGDYGPATAKAVQEFAGKNNIASDGKSVSTQLAGVILHRHRFLPEMYVLWSIHTSDLRTRKYISKGTRTSISAIQSLLNEIGYGKELDFSKYGADGIFGPNTGKAVITYAKNNGIESDGDLLTRPLIDLLLEDINRFYDRNWSDLVVNNLPDLNPPLVYFEGSRFQGKPCRVDRLFVPSLERINQYAEEANVFVRVTSSFRTSTNVNGAIVKPAIRSNHLAGHAIDMNVVYGPKRIIATSRELIKFPDIPDPVKQFINSIIKDPGLRWGGEFSTPDVVHIDEGLNQDAVKWKKRYEIMQKAMQMGG